MSNYIYEEHIVIPKYSGSITLTSGNASKMYDGSALSNHTVTQSNLVITDLNTNTQASNPKFTATYSSWSSNNTENSTVSNSFTVSGDRWYINNTEDITQYIASSDKTISKVYGKLILTDNPMYPNVGGGHFILNGNSWSGSAATEWGYSQHTPPGDKGVPSPSNITINGTTYKFAYEADAFQRLVYTTSIHSNSGSTGPGYEVGFTKRSGATHILSNYKIYIKNTNNNKYKILPCVWQSSMDWGSITWSVASSNDDLNFKSIDDNIPLDIYFLPA